MNNFNNFGSQMTGVGYNAHNDYKKAKMTQLLTEDDLKLIRKQPNSFSLTISTEDSLIAKCTHKDPKTGEFAIRTLDDGITTVCTVCGDHFHIVDYNKDVATKKCYDVVDLIQTIKTLYVDIPRSYVEDIADMIPLLKLLPRLHEYALTNFEKYNGDTDGIYSNNAYGGFDMLNAISSPNTGMANMGGMAQPVSNQIDMQQQLLAMQQELNNMKQQGANPFNTNTNAMPQASAPEKTGNPEVVSTKSFNV